MAKSSKELTALASEYLVDKHYEEENLGIDWLNLIIKEKKVKDVSIIFKWFRAGKQYSDFRGIIKHEATFRLLNSEAPAEYGLAKSEVGLVFICKLG